MIQGKKILALIPARGGSKGIKNKNIVDINGIPLIGYTIQEAIKSRYIDDVVVTTDSEKIQEIASAYGADVPFLRPTKLASDLSTTLEAVLHAIEELKNLGRNYDILVLLQPTTPLRTVNDIDNAITKFEDHLEIPLASVSEAQDNPIFIREIENDGTMKKCIQINSTIRRQDMKKVYRINGGIYINRIDELNKNTSFNDNPLAFIMEKSHSIDIDEFSDIILMKYYLEKKSAME